MCALDCVAIMVKAVNKNNLDSLDSMVERMLTNVSIANNDTGMAINLMRANMSVNATNMIDKINDGGFTKEELINLKRNAVERNRTDILEAIELHMQNKIPLAKKKNNIDYRDVIDSECFKKKYTLIRDELKDKSPSMWAAVVSLCENVPELINEQTIWEFGRDKPCYSNIKVAVGERVAADLMLSKSFESFSEIADSAWEIRIIDKGTSWKKNTNFEFLGDSVKQFLSNLSNGGLKSYRWKFFAIREFAIALNASVGPARKLIKELIDKQYLEANELRLWSTTFAKAVGMGWGFITVNHMLTDLGVSIKPDLHLRRTAVRMGLFRDIDTRLTIDEIDKLKPEIDFNIVELLVDLVQHVECTAFIHAEGAHKRKVALREMDKVLMEWSRQELLRPLDDVCVT